MTTPQHWKPAVMVWRWEDAPEEFRSLSPYGDGSEESVVYVPPAVIDADGEYEAPAAALRFLNWLPKPGSNTKYAGNEWGWYALFNLPDGGRVAITSR